MAVTVNIPIENAVTDGSLNPVTSNAVFDGLAGKASGTGTANGTNTGDETTNTIKTKLGSASGSTDGYLLQADWNTFNGKQATLVSGTNIKTINSTTILGSGDIVTSHLGNSDLTSTANIRTFTLNGATGSNGFRISNGTNVLFEVLGNGRCKIPGPGFTSDSVIIGAGAGANNTGNYNIALGGEAANQNTAGSQSVSIGWYTARGSQNNFSVNIGVKAGTYIADGVTFKTSNQNNVYIGQNVLASTTISSNEIGIGQGVICQGSNTITIGNTAITDTFIRGSIICGDTVALATTAITGFLYAPSCAGIPTGVPTARTGKIPFVVDATNNKAYIYSGGAWVPLN